MPSAHWMLWAAGHCVSVGTDLILGHVREVEPSVLLGLPRAKSILLRSLAVWKAHVARHDGFDRLAITARERVVVDRVFAADVAPGVDEHEARVLIACIRIAL